MGFESNIPTDQPTIAPNLSDRALLMMVLSELSALREENIYLSNQVEEMSEAMSDMLEMIEEDTLDTKRVAKMLGVSAQTVRKLIDEGRLKAASLNPIKVKRSKVKQYLDSVRPESKSPTADHPIFGTFS